VIYTPSAKKDIGGAVTYLFFKRSAPQAARALIRELDETVKRVMKAPYAGSLYRTDRAMRDEIRWVTVKSFVLYYAVTEDTVQIRRFLHGRQNRKITIYPNHQQTALGHRPGRFVVYGPLGAQGPRGREYPAL